MSREIADSTSDSGPNPWSSLKLTYLDPSTLRGSSNSVLLHRRMINSAHVALYHLGDWQSTADAGGLHESTNGFIASLLEVIN